MDKKTVLAELVKMADEFDSKGAFENADALTEVAKRLAQFDDDFGGGSWERDDDYNVHEENELMRDQWLERQSEGEGRYSSEEEAMEAARYRQANEANVPYVMLRDIDTDDDRETTYDVMPLEEYNREGSYLEGYRDIPPANHEELARYHRDLETETPLGMELDGGFDDFGPDMD